MNDIMVSRRIMTPKRVAFNDQQAKTPQGVKPFANIRTEIGNAYGAESNDYGKSGKRHFESRNNSARRSLTPGSS